MTKIKTLLDYTVAYQKSVIQPELFWEEIALKFKWRKKWDKILDWDFELPKIEWFKNARLNITENVFERNLKKNGNKNAIIWEPNDPKEKSVKITYNELFNLTCQFANALKSSGIK